MTTRVSKFLPEDFELLLKKIATLEAKLIDCGQELGQSTEQSSETYHDNATYDVARMNFEILASELQRLIEARNSAIIINPAPDLTQQVIIGSVVTILNEKTGDKQKVKITGNVE